MKRCIIFSAGTLYKPYPVPQGGDYIIAADAGLKNCNKAGFTPNLTLGDWDSMAMPAPVDTLTYPVEKDDTDTMLAIKKALEDGYKEIHIYGGTGGRRSDHTLANMQGLAYIATHGSRGYLHDRGCIYTAIYNDKLNIPAPRRGSILSIFSMTTVSGGVSLTGVKYPLEEGSLNCDFPLGVSNSIVSDRASVSVRDGILLIGIGV